jgi:hypothetical protein
MVKSDFRRFLTFIRDLNSTSRYYKIGQSLLNIALQGLTLEEFYALYDKHEKSKDNNLLKDKNKAKNDLDIILAFADRHY